jgi:hypothetical protein
MSARVKHFSSALLHALKEERRFALVDGVASVFCLRTRFVRISAASPVHSSKCNSESNRSNQRAFPLAFHPHTHLYSLGPEMAIKVFRLLTVLQSPFLELPGVCIHKRNC